jgi:hypothetical protein
VLNKRLLRRGDAQATCLALSIAMDGQAALANAGHMAPYLNAEALQLWRLRHSGLDRKTTSASYS